MNLDTYILHLDIEILLFVINYAYKHGSEIDVFRAGNRLVNYDTENAKRLFQEGIKRVGGGVVIGDLGL